MKKLWGFILVLALTCSTAVCAGIAQEEAHAPSAQQQQVTGSGRETDSDPIPNAFWVQAGDDQIYEGLTFEEDITITIDPAATMEQRAQILFADCAFHGNIQVIGDDSAFLRFTEGCVFGEDCQITVFEATQGIKDRMTIEDDLVKLLFLGSSPAIQAESICNVICYNGEGIVVDGVAYRNEDYLDHNGFCVATYFENGEKRVFATGIDE